MLTLANCIPCLLKQSLTVLEMNGVDTAKTNVILRKIISSLAEFDEQQSPPEILSGIYSLIKDETGVKDPYKTLKKNSIKNAFIYLEAASIKVKNSDDPFKSAVSYSIAANIMDFGVPDIDEKRIDAVFSADIINKNIDELKVKELFNSIKNAETILYLGDNAGETVFDRLLIENFPGNADVYYAVRGAPVINDAVYEDALNSGIDKVAKIISNGAAIPGTVLQHCSDKFKDIFYKASLVIAKGQGNFETLNDSERKVHFLFQVKCPVIGSEYQFHVGDWIITDSLTIRERLNNENCCSVR